MLKKWILLILSGILIMLQLQDVKAATANANDNYLSEAYVLMEASTGTVLHAKNENIRLRPASITKIMTLLLIFEAFDSGRIQAEDIVTVSEHAASLGGSQVFLEPGETQCVKDMIKCICISSANDASVAMAEHLSGSEEEFVKRMNEKAAELGMTNTCFVNCYGLDTDGHYTSAMDVALMSRELITKHPGIFDFSTIWMDSITHVTKKGSSIFGLSNTNKLLKTYNGITGLKTGSTGLAKYCLSATARRNEMDMIAVIMAAPDTKTRFSEAAALLNQGFAEATLYRHNKEEVELPKITVRHGKTEQITAVIDGSFRYVCLNEIKPENISWEVSLDTEIDAPVKIGTKLGSVIYKNGLETIGTLDIISSEDCERAGYGDCLLRCFTRFLRP